MPRENRATQFAPFDALKGLSSALRLKELEREKEVHGELTKEQIEEIMEVELAFLQDEYD